jgi:hypothetical protein
MRSLVLFTPAREDLDPLFNAGVGRSIVRRPVQGIVHVTALYRWNRAVAKLTVKGGRAFHQTRILGSSEMSGEWEPS